MENERYEMNFKLILSLLLLGLYLYLNFKILK